MIIMYYVSKDKWKNSVLILDEASGIFGKVFGGSGQSPGNLFKVYSNTFIKKILKSYNLKSINYNN